MNAKRSRWRRWGDLPASGLGLVLVGLVIGLGASVLEQYGNPPNMGVCIACFQRDIAGALGLHRASVVQYLRPEIPALVLGAFVAALIFGEFKPRGGSGAILRFMLGVFAMVGALVFLGCTWRVLLRLGGGDGNALVGLGGVVTGIAAGSLFLRRGYSLGRPTGQPYLAGLIGPAVMVLLLVLLVAGTSFKPGQAIFASAKGPGAMHAGVVLSLAVGLVIGFLGQRSRFCTVGAVRDLVLIRNTRLAGGMIAVIAGALAFNLVAGKFNAGFAGMPISHSDHLWNFLSMVLAGLAFCLAGGCPGRQLFMCGQGDTDSSIFIAGAIAGAAICHNWFLAAVPDKVVDGVVTVGGPGQWGRIAVIVGLVFCVMLGLLARDRPVDTA
ncbi:MAG: YedE-related selenium metabolism membrane protein [bacterium]|nr:YedE-related selenium metabolism membrane protein [bacterium]